MPCISDPGEQIVKDAIARGITVTPVPGASACVTALAVSGQDTARFVFEGFLPVPKKERRERLEFLQGETRTVILYEAPTSCAEHWTTCAPPLARSAPLPCAGS